MYQWLLIAESCNSLLLQMGFFSGGSCSKPLSCSFPSPNLPVSGSPAPARQACPRRWQQQSGVGWDKPPLEQEDGLCADPCLGETAPNCARVPVLHLLGRVDLLLRSWVCSAPWPGPRSCGERGRCSAQGPPRPPAPLLAVLCMVMERMAVPFAGQT